MPRLGWIALPVLLIAPAAVPAAPEPFVCTQVMGVSVTGDWFAAGFEALVDGARFQAVTRTHAFVELWGNPKDPVWSIPPVSPCARDAASCSGVL